MNSNCAALTPSVLTYPGHTSACAVRDIPVLDGLDVQEYVSIGYRFTLTLKTIIVIILQTNRVKRTVSVRQIRNVSENGVSVYRRSYKWAIPVNVCIICITFTL